MPVFSLKMVMIGSLGLLILFTYTCHSQEVSNGSFKYQRNLMVLHQLQKRGISDSLVLSAFRKVERHKFVDPNQWSSAYGDYPLPIGYGQTISQPYIVAFMTESLHPSKLMKVLEVGTGSGYQAAILGELCDKVFSVEIVDSLARRAIKVIQEMGYRNILIKTGDGYLGWPEYAPFDAIIVTCSPSHIPKPLIDQLADNGRMIIPVGNYPQNQELILLVKKGNRIMQEAVLPVRFVPMLTPDGRNY